MAYLIIPIILFLILSGLAIISTSWASEYRNEEDADFRPARRGCILSLAGLFLRPVPMILAFYQFGFPAAVMVALVVWFASRCIDIFKKGFGAGTHVLQVILPIGALLTLLTANTVFFQVIPSAGCAAYVLYQLYGLVSGNSNLFPGDKTESVFSRSETKLARWGILGASAIALIVSEYARQNLSLTGWIWYYGYLRLELLPVFIGAMVPAMIKMSRRSESEQNQKN